MGTVGGNLLQDNLCLYYNRPPMLRLPLDPCLKLGGVVCHAVSGSQECWAVYSGDLAPVLLVLGASVTIASSEGTRTVPVMEIFSGDGKQPNRLKPGEVLTEIRIPPPGPYSGSVYLKLRRRKAIDYPLLGVAMQVNLEPGSGICRDLSLAMTAVGQTPLMVRETENLRGRRIGSEEIEALAQAAFKQARPLSNVSEVTPKYRREMVKVYVKMAARQALDRAMEKGAHV
jgi:4-hydroxybenzoyl-CoA reductase subunit beta